LSGDGYWPIRGCPTWFGQGTTGFCECSALNL
jgi:hypothetical protein